MTRKQKTKNAKASLAYRKRGFFAAWQLLALVCAVVGLSCGSDKKTSQSGRIGSDVRVTKTPGGLKLSWAPVKSEITSYHVFYTKNIQSQKNGNEIDSLVKEQVSEKLFKAPAIVLDRTNIDPYPPLGSKVCFYVEARNDQVRSDPSQSVCTVLE